jgi:8-oxo-dGTP diphosphatase
MDAVKHSVAFVIYHNDRSRFLIVRRPPDDESLPNVWGLPAGSLKEDESFEEAVVRSARDKLGVKVRVVRMQNEGEIQRKGHLQHMQEYEVALEDGELHVPQSVTNVTQYVEWKWGSADDLLEAAQKGSLCSRLFLQYAGRTW